MGVKKLATVAVEIRGDDLWIRVQGRYFLFSTLKTRKPARVSDAMTQRMIAQKIARLLARADVVQVDDSQRGGTLLVTPERAMIPEERRKRSRWHPFDKSTRWFGHRVRLKRPIVQFGSEFERKATGTVSEVWQGKMTVEMDDGRILSRVSHRSLEVTDLKNDRDSD